MSIEKLYKVFMHFLNQNGIFYVFATELYRQETKSIHDHVSMFSNKPHLFIMEAFSWNGSFDGANYWAKIDDKWRKTLKRVLICSGPPTKNKYKSIW